MSQTAYRPADIAKELGVSVNTIRGWCNTFGDHLSERATPRRGQERTISELDRTILHYIAGLRGEGYNYDEILSRLDETTFTDAEVLGPAEVPTEPQETGIQSTQDVALAVLASSVQTIAEHLQDATDSRRELDSLRTENRQELNNLRIEVHQIAEHLQGTADSQQELDSLRTEVHQLRTYLIVGGIGALVLLFVLILGLIFTT